MNEQTWRRGVLWVIITRPHDRLPHCRDSAFADSQGSSPQSLNLMVVLICPLNFCYPMIPALWTYEIYFVSGKCLSCILNVLIFPPSLSSFSQAQQSPSLPSHRNIPVSGLWSGHCPFGSVDTSSLQTILCHHANIWSAPTRSLSGFSLLWLFIPLPKSA